MEIIEQVSLVDFYRHQTAALRGRGFLGLLMVLARQADAPNVYIDLIRYWNDLHHITGSHVLFAVAGMPQSGDRAVVVDGVHNNAVSIAPNGGIEGMFRSKRDLDEHFSHQSRYIEQNSWWKPQYKQAPRSRGIEGATASQTSELRYYLNIPEAQTPCLHLTLIQTAPLRSFVFPMDDYSGLSLWVSVKRIMSRLSEPIDEFERTVRSRRFENLPALDAELLKQMDQLTGPIQRISEIRSALSETKRLKQRNLNRRAARSVRLHELLSDPSIFPDEKGILSRAIQYCGEPGASKEAAWQLFNSIKARQFLDKQSLQYLQAFIDSSLDISREAVLSSELAVLEETVKPMLEQLEATQSNVRTVENAMQSASKKIRDDRMITEMTDLCSTLPRCPVLSWDFFISYPSPDRDIAAALWMKLSTFGECFFDQRMLKPGEKWANDLVLALEHSSCIVVLVSKHTALAHYQVSEIQRAVDLHRKKATRILVALREGASLPFGLEQFQCIKWEAESALISSIADAVDGHRTGREVRS